MILNPDFTCRKYAMILDSLLYAGYSFKTVEEHISDPFGKFVMLRHDVDRLPLNSLMTAQMEHSRGIRGTYYFRIVKQSNVPDVIREIAALGHEIGYHYEDLNLTGGDTDKAIENFGKNLEYFRQFYPVKTICMHGSPSSKTDNRDIWKKRSYRDYGILLEPYFDLDYSSILYMTDTGRKWNGDKSSVRDKVFQEQFNSLKDRIKTSDQVIAAAISGDLPDKIMITVHPQRWTDNPFLWTGEFAAQKLKNIIKQFLFVK
jgi:hypothetical protein